MGNVLSFEPRTEFASAHVRHWGTTGSQMLVASFSLFDSKQSFDTTWAHERTASQFATGVASAKPLFFSLVRMKKARTASRTREYALVSAAQRALYGNVLDSLDDQSILFIEQILFGLPDCFGVKRIYPGWTSALPSTFTEPGTD
jgi:hypothetical protein